MKAFKELILSVVVLLLAVAASCGGHGGRTSVLPVPQPPSGRAPAVCAYVAQSGATSVVGAPGTARGDRPVTIIAGTKVFVVSAKSDGSFEYELPAGIAPPVQVHFTTPSGEVKNLAASTFNAEAHLKRNYFTTGQAPNDMVLAQGKFYIANSMDNNVQIRDATTLESVATLALPEYASPSYLFVSHSTTGFVTCNGNNTLVAFNPNDGSELWTLELPSEGLAFLGPGKPYANGSYVFVPLANIESFGDPSTYRKAEVFVVSIATHEIEKRITLAGEDALEVARLRGGQLVVVEAGNLSFDENWQPYTTTSSYLEVIDEASKQVVRTLDLGAIGAARPLVDVARNRIYLASLLNGNLYTVNSINWTMERGEGNPVIVGAQTSYLADLMLIDDSIIASSFNEDRLYAISPLDFAMGAWPLPEPLDIGSGEEGFLAGAQRLAWDQDSRELYILQGLANRVGRFDMP